MLWPTDLSPSGGKDERDAFCAAGIALFSYMADLEKIDRREVREISAEGTQYGAHLDKKKKLKALWYQSKQSIFTLNVRLLEVDYIIIMLIAYASLPPHWYLQL